MCARKILLQLVQESRLVAGLVLNEELKRVLFSFIWINLTDSVQRNTAKTKSKHGIKWANITLFDLDYADDLIF
jgi:hypothetical protein